MHQCLPCSMEMLESMKLHKDVPHAPLQRPSSPAENLLDDEPICDDMHALYNKQS
jgi:hypothetical protein